MSPADRRLQLGAAAIMSPTAAAELLPWAESRSMEWLERNHLVIEVPGMGRALIWRDVEAAIRMNVTHAEAAPAPRRATLPRSSRV